MGSGLGFGVNKYYWMLERAPDNVEFRVDKFNTKLSLFYIGFNNNTFISLEILSGFRQISF